MLTQATKTAMKSKMQPILAAAGIKATYSVYRDNLIVKIKLQNSKINFIQNYNENRPSVQKASVILTIESFNSHWFSGEAKKVVSSLFSIAKSAGCSLAIDYSDY